MSPFVRATKSQIKARVALEGPTGAGKTLTALSWASAFGERIAVLDTERGRARLYSDRFTFDVQELSPPFSPQAYERCLREASDYDVIVVDSLSHAWEGEGGVLDIVDAAATRAHGNSFAGWKEGTPALRSLIDRMLGLNAHLIVTMRSKMEYVLDTDQRGKQVPRKVGMAPIMRQNVDYEFDLVADMDLEHRMVISKSRCSLLADRVIPSGEAKAHEAAQEFLAWLNDGDAPPPTVGKEDADRLAASLNALPTEVRAPLKREFASIFGRPEAVTSARLDEARSWIAERKGGVEGPTSSGVQ